MKIKHVLRVIAFICLVVSSAMLFPFCLALYDKSDDLFAFAISILTGVTFSVALLFYTRVDEPLTVGIREGVGITGFSWVFASLIGALPYVLSGKFSGFTDAFFETMSGFTTTGATILPNIEAMPRGILLWRSLTHWIGGMGIIVLSLAVFPFLGVSGMEMYKAEVPGVTAGKVTPRLHQTALSLWGVYVLLTLLETVLLIFGGMSLFDAVCHSFSTIATGGFSTKNASIAYFNSSYIHWVITVFMFLSGVNFSLYFLIPQKKFRDIFADEELRCYTVIVLIASLLIALSLYFTRELSGFENLIRRSMFKTISIMTTTGFIISDFDEWPDFCRFILVILMFIGASGGSTGGGFKVSRLQILFRHMKTETLKLLHPRAVINPRMNAKPIPNGTVMSSTAFFVLYLILFAVSTLITTCAGVDFISAFSGVLTCISNVGPGLNNLGAVEHFGNLPVIVKWLLSFCMLAGRLELFAVFLLFLPSTYKK